MCTGPISASPRSVALFLARITTFLALSVNRSSIAAAPSGEPGAQRGGGAGPQLAPATSVLLVYGLPGHAEDLGDVLPGPPLVPRVVDLQCLEMLEQPAESAHGPQPGTRVRAVGGRRQGGCVVHGVNLR